MDSAHTVFASGGKDVKLLYTNDFLAEIARRRSIAGNSRSNLIDVISQIAEEWHGTLFEHACAIHRRKTSNYWQIQRFAVGTETTVSLPTKQIILNIMRWDSDALVLCHNHPNASTKPSSQDIHITRKIAQACNVLGVTLVDHIIFGIEPCFSFRAVGYL